MTDDRGVTSLKAHFTAFLAAEPQRLHVAAHSHHPWPDVSLAAQERAWRDAAQHQDAKWDVVFGEVLPEARRRIADVLGLEGDGTTLAVAPNTHELLVRILSCLPAPTRVLTTDAEFHSASRQLRRLEEDGLAEVERVPAQPFATFVDRFSAAAARGGHHLVLCSVVHFDSGFVVPDVGAAIAAAVPDPSTFVVLDGYHHFMAVPAQLDTATQRRAFYVAGGYKYAMAGEGACFLHCPPGYGERPRTTGWFAGFADLERPVGGRVAYGGGGDRFLGATFDPTAWYRFVAVQRWLEDVGWDVARVHAHVGLLQRRFLERLDDVLDATARDRLGVLLPARDEVADRGHFLTFAGSQAADVHRALAAERVVTDLRGDRLRIGLGVANDEGDVDELVVRLARALVDGRE